MKKLLTPFNVLVWDFNRDALFRYDVMPYLLSQWEEMMKHRRRKDFHKPSTFDEVKEWILKESRYQFWSRCQYEIVVTGFPPGKNDTKIDVFAQIEMNIDIITRLFMESVAMDS